MAMASISLICDKCGDKYVVSRKCHSRKEADSYEEYIYNTPPHLCRTCKGVELAAQRHEAEEAKSAECAEKAKKAGFPPLIGSARQNAWAETLRIDCYNLINRMYIGCTYKGIPINADNKASVGADVAVFFRTANSAKVYIDNRTSSVQQWLDLIARFSSGDSAKDVEKASTAAAAAAIECANQSIIDKASAVVTPVIQEHVGVVKISVRNGYVVVKYERDSTFSEIVRSLGYRWDSTIGRHVKKITGMTNDADECVAELGNKLLLAGFSVSIADAEQRQRAIDADYTPECTRWVTRIASGKYEGRLAIKWYEKNDDLYAAARSIRGSIWASSSVLVPIEQYAEVEDFADVYDFKLSKGAKEAICVYHESMMPPVKPIKQPEPERVDKLAEILKTPNDVLPDHMDV